MKIALIGCSADTLFLTKSLAQEARKMKIDRISFFDRDPAVRSVFCLFCVSLCKSLDSQIRCVVETNVVEALIGADYIVTDLNGLTDPRPQETAVVLRRRDVLVHPFLGAAVFGAALRHVPDFLRLCGQAKRYAKPDVKLLNLTAPGGVILQAAWKSGYDFVYGFPLFGIKTAASLTKLMKKEPSAVSCSFFGSAELSVISDVYVGGKQILPELLKEDALYQDSVFSHFSKTMLIKMGCLPAPLWSVCFYPEQYLNLQRQSDAVPEAEIYQAQMRCLAALSSVDFEKQRHATLSAVDQMLKTQSSLTAQFTQDYDLPEALNPYYTESTSPALAVICYLRAKSADEKSEVPMLRKNENALSAFSEDDIVSVRAFISADETQTIPAYETAPDIMEWIRRQGYFERKLAGAMIAENESAMINALAMQPLVNSFSVASEIFGDLKKINL